MHSFNVTVRFKFQTADTRPRSRGTIRPRFACRCLPQTREQGMPDARCTRGLVCKVARVKKRTRAYRAAENIRHSLRNGLTAYGALTPENSWPLSPPSPRGNRHVSPVGHAAPPQDLTPTSFRHRVHTLLPYAPAPLVNTFQNRSRSLPALPSHRAHDAAASTAIPSQRSVTMANAPSKRTGWRDS